MINENDLLDYLRTLINGNTSSLFSGIVQQGQQRGFAHITQSTLTPPTGYYFLAMDIKSVAPVAKLQVLDTTITAPLYTVELTVVDYLTPADNETELYERYHRDFRTVTDRLYNLLDTHQFTGQWRRPDQYNLTKQNQPIGFEEAESYHAYATSTLTFVVEGC